MHKLRVGTMMNIETCHNSPCISACDETHGHFWFPSHLLAPVGHLPGLLRRHLSFHLTGTSLLHEKVPIRQGQRQYDQW